MAMLVSALVFGVTVLLLVMGLTFCVSAALVPAQADTEKRFEKRLEYGVMGGAGIILFIVMLFIS
ncbi:hypothetical protein [Rheinheimera salexigens]|uniref:Uncharacterized protein n=1 Tax=Rheinheimera salexigens TaxID=1628148 RepID=A0A1E7Q917_9GAMM|nr:hypothetical protein [Rheinheimera salexigens]OEY70591.1 hypothetical protein BI198_14210 [Rheinheimera salexigens]